MYNRLAGAASFEAWLASESHPVSALRHEWIIDLPTMIVPLVKLELPT